MKNSQKVGDEPKCDNKGRGQCVHSEDDGNVDGGNRHRIFKDPADEDKINELSYKQFAVQSKRKIKWAVNMYCDSRENRLKDGIVAGPILNSDLNLGNQFTQGDLCYALVRFIREVKKLDGSDFPPNTLRELIIMIQMHLQQNGVYWKLLDGKNFVDLRNVLDNTMKERTAMGLGVRQSSEVISMAHENKMFESGVLGESNPQQLLDTVIYMLGLHLALRGGIEHCKLRRPGFNSQINVELDENSGREVMIYCEDPQHKTNQGGLNSKRTSKVVKVFPSANVSRCPVRLYGKYIGLLPQSKSCGKLYLRPKVKKCPTVWFCDQPFGRNKISNTAKKLCEIANIQGKFSNHSLRATSASRMFQKDVPEQVIKEITGHRSDCVRTYKKTSDNILKRASETISGVDECTKKEASACDLVEVVDGRDGEICKEKKGKLTACQIIKNVIKTRMEMRNRKKTNRRVLSKVAKKIVKRQKMKKIRTSKNVKATERKFVIDLNINVNYKK